MPNFDPNMQINNSNDARAFLSQLRYRFTIDPQNNRTPGETRTLTWNVENVGNQQVEMRLRGLNSLSLQRDLSGSVTDNPSSTTTYSLEATVHWMFTSPRPNPPEPTPEKTSQILQSITVDIGNTNTNAHPCQGIFVRMGTLSDTVNNLLRDIRLREPASLEASPVALTIKFTIVVPMPEIPLVNIEDATISVNASIAFQVQNGQALCRVLQVNAVPHFDPPDLPLVPDQLEPWHWIVEWLADKFEEILAVDVNPVMEFICIQLQQQLNNEAARYGTSELNGISVRERGILLIMCPRLIVYDPHVREPRPRNN